MYLSENTATTNVLISLMVYSVLQRILELSFGVKAVLKSAKYLVQEESKDINLKFLPSLRKPELYIFKYKVICQAW